MPTPDTAVEVLTTAPQVGAVPVDRWRGRAVHYQLGHTRPAGKLMLPACGPPVPPAPPLPAVADMAFADSSHLSGSTADAGLYDGGGVR